MRLSLILGVCIVLCGAVMAQATGIPCPVTTGAVAGDINYVRTASVYGSALDEIDIYLSGLPSPGNKLQLLEGTWTASGVANAGIALVQTFTTTGKTPITYSDWRDFTAATAANAAAAVTYYPSYVNFDVDNVPSGAHSDFWNEVGPVATLEGTPMYSAFSGSWDTQNALKALGVDGLVATMYVTHGAQLAFDGHFGNPGAYTTGGWGWQNSVNTNGGFSTVPEPSTLLLAAGGLVSLLCYAWRKRR
jgi:hypothetical protein